MLAGKNCRFSVDFFHAIEILTTEARLNQVRREEEEGYVISVRIDASDRSASSWCSEDQTCLDGSILGELVPYFEYFDLVSWFEISISGASDLTTALSVRTDAVLVEKQFR